MGALLIIVATAAFARLCRLAWDGQLGLIAIGMLLIAAVTFSFARKNIRADYRAFADLFAKVGFTIAGCMALLRHPIPCPPDGNIGCVPLPVYQTITAYIDKVDVPIETFLLFAGIAMGVKFV